MKKRHQRLLRQILFKDFCPVFFQYTFDKIYNSNKGTISVPAWHMVQINSS